LTVDTTDCIAPLVRYASQMRSIVPLLEDATELDAARLHDQGLAETIFTTVICITAIATTKSLDIVSLTPPERRSFRICAGSPTGKAFGGYLMSLRIHRYQRQRPAQLTMCQTLVAILLKSTHRYASTIHSPTGTPLDCNVDYQRTVPALLLLLEHSYNHTSRQLTRRE
jgi:hypothetical protein